MSEYHPATAVCEFSHKSDANGLWNLLGTCEIWYMRSPTGLWQFFQLWLLFLRNYDLFFRDLSRPLRLVKKACCIAYKKKYSTIYSSGFLRQSCQSKYFFCFRYVDWSIWWNIMYRNFWLVETVKEINNMGHNVWQIKTSYINTKSRWISGNLIP